MKLTDKREFKAKVLGSDKASDIAVLRIDAKNLPTVKIGNPDRRRSASGSSRSASRTASRTPSRRASSAPRRVRCRRIRTCASSNRCAVNPGNSGGPLFNRGEVIGVNSQIFSRSGGFQGLAFAVPIDLAMQVKDEIQQHGKVTRGKLAITIQEVSQALADNFGLKGPGGALVSSVQKDGPGAKAGLEPGDVILKFDGKEISRSSDLPPLVATLKPGATATLDIWRNGKPKQLSVTVGRLDEGSSGLGTSASDSRWTSARSSTPRRRRPTAFTAEESAPDRLSSTAGL
jgi:serine protease Do